MFPHLLTSRRCSCRSDELITLFQQAKTKFVSINSMFLPRTNDQLWIVTDGALKSHGIGATLYVTRGGKPRLTWFFQCKTSSTSGHLATTRNRGSAQ